MCFSLNNQNLSLFFFSRTFFRCLSSFSFILSLFVFLKFCLEHSCLYNSMFCSVQLKQISNLFKISLQLRTHFSVFIFAAKLKGLIVQTTHYFVLALLTLLISTTVHKSYTVKATKDLHISYQKKMFLSLSHLISQQLFIHDFLTFYKLNFSYYLSQEYAVPVFSLIY